MGDDNEAQKLSTKGAKQNSQRDRPAPGMLTIKGGFWESGNLAQPAIRKERLNAKVMWYWPQRSSPVYGCSRVQEGLSLAFVVGLGKPLIRGRCLPLLLRCKNALLAVLRSFIGKFKIPQA